MVNWRHYRAKNAHYKHSRILTLDFSVQHQNSLLFYQQPNINPRSYTRESIIRCCSVRSYTMYSLTAGKQYRWSWLINHSAKMNWLTRATNQNKLLFYFQTVRELKKITLAILWIAKKKSLIYSAFDLQNSDI